MNYKRRHVLLIDFRGERTEVAQVAQNFSKLPRKPSERGKIQITICGNLIRTFFTKDN